MKKTLLAVAMSTLFVFGAAQAESNDVSATLNITGSVTNSDTGCTVVLPVNTLSVDGDVALMNEQGAATTTPTKIVNMSVVGGAACDSLASQGKLAYKFIGTADSADGNVLANTMSGEGAASGIGIGLFDENGTVVNINSGTLPVISGMTKLGMALVKLKGQDAVGGAVQGSLTIQIERL